MSGYLSTQKVCYLLLPRDDFQFTLPRKADVRLPEKRELQFSWREAGPPNHLDDNVDLDQQVVNKALSLPTCLVLRVWGSGCEVLGVGV